MPKTAEELLRSFLLFYYNYPNGYRYPDSARNHF